MRETPENPIIFSLDVESLEEARRFVELLEGLVWGFKVGKGLFTAAGPEVVQEVIKKWGRRVFLDLKFHDIPTTVSQAVAAAVNLGVAMLNVHCLGGRGMMEAAAEAAKKEAEKRGVFPPLVLGVTILTSLTQADLKEVGITEALEDEVVRLALLAKEAGLDGVVASPQEVAVVRRACGEGFFIVTPGVRPVGEQHHDQARVMTPAGAIRSGADYLVIGRPIREAADPAAAARAILAEVRAAR